MDSSVDKESACSVGDPGLIPGLGRSRGEKKGYPLQSSGLENAMDCIVRGVAKSQTQLNDFHFHAYRVSRCCTIHALITGLNYVRPFTISKLSFNEWHLLNPMLLQCKACSILRDCLRNSVVGEHSEELAEDIGLLFHAVFRRKLGRAFIVFTLLCALSLSRVRIFATLWTVARQAPLSMGFSRQEYWSGLPCLLQPCSSNQQELFFP